VRVQRQPNVWSCLPTALAMLVDKPVAEIIHEYGHDGSQPVPGNPFDRLCFTDLETVKVALKLVVHLVPISAYSRVSVDGKEQYTNDQTFGRMLDIYSGILLGNWHCSGVGHALYWENRHSLAIDPDRGDTLFRGHLYDRYNVEVLLAWLNRA